MYAPVRQRLVALVGVATAVVALGQPARAMATSTGTSSASTATSSITSCPTKPPSPPTPQTPLPSTQIAGPAGIGSIFASASKIQIVKTDSRSMVTVNTTELTSSSAAINAPYTWPGWVALDSSGATYVLRYPYTVARLDAAGNDVWSYTQALPLRAVFAYGTGAAERVGVVYRDRAASLALTTAGVPIGEINVSGDTFTRTASGGMVATDGGRYVRLYDANAVQRLAIGDSHKDNDPSPAAAPLHFYQLGGAAQLPDGRLLVTDTQRGVMVFSPSGLYLGSIGPALLSALGLTQQSSIVVAGSYVYLAVGGRFTNNQYVIRIGLANMLSRVMTPIDARLGVGAGITDASTDNYTPFGSVPDVRAVFDPWWSTVAPTLTLCWTLRSSDQLHSGTLGSVGALPGAQWTYSAPGTPLALPGGLAPGAYTIDASLLQAGVAVSSTRLVMTLGAEGQRLSMDALPAGADWGGPAAARGVALTDELGTKTFRDQLDWHRLLDNGPTAPLDFSYYDDRFTAGAAQAAQRGDTFIVQVGQGGPEKDLVANGTWAARVHEVVDHFKGVVHTWEAWNEPNITYGSAADYVTNVLAPFYREVKAVDPSAVVVGGSVVGVDVPYWKGIIAAGGLADLDVASVHPYTGHNRTWEEQGTIAQLRELKPLLVRDGLPVPLWITELAWWSDGAANLFRQADASSRALLWMADLGIDKWAYFIPEGGWGNYGLTFSAIQVNDYVKPSALAIMTTTSQLAGRPFLGEVDLGAPASYAMRFGPRAGDPRSGELLVAWTDDVDLQLVLNADQTGRSVDVTEELGAASTSTLNGPTPFTISGSPVFLSLDGPGHLSLTPAESFGADVAAQSAGATATATSSLTANRPDGAIDGDSGANGLGDLAGMPAWASAPGDTTPALTVDLAYAQTIDRILVATHSIGSVVPGLRDYDVQVRANASAPWATVAEIRGQFFQRQRVITLPAQTVSGIRIVVKKLDFTGMNEDGSPPFYWVFDPQGTGGPAVVSELEAFAPGATTAARKAVALTVAAPTSPQLIGSSTTVTASIAGLFGGVAGRRVDLMRGNTVVASAVSSAFGSVQLRTVIRATAAYSVRVSGDDAYLPATSTVFTIHASDRTKSTLEVARTFSAKRQPALLIAKVAWASNGRGITAARVELWGYRSHWSLVTAKLTNYAGRIAFWLPAIGPRTYRLVFRGKTSQSVLALPSSTGATAVPVR